MRNTLNGSRFAALALLQLLALTSVSADVVFSNAFEPPRPVTAQVVITPGFRLLTQPGETAQLSAATADGGALPAQVGWHSNDPATVTVDQTGQLTAQATGSALITASAIGAAPATIMVTVAVPAAGVTLVDDVQVTSAPVPVDDQAPYGLGYQYTIGLQNLTPPLAGDLLMGTGQTPLAGRVLASASTGSGVTVTLEVVPLDVLFDQLVIDERMNLKNAPVVVEAAIEDLFSVTRFDDGSVLLVPGANGQKGVAQGTVVDPLLDCSDSTVTSPLQILTMSTGADLSLNTSLSVDLDYDVISGDFGLDVNGGVTAVAEFKPRTVAAFEGKLSCKLKVAKIVIPIGGPLAWIFGGSIPIGIGIEVSGKVSTSQQIGYDLTIVGQESFSGSLQCRPDCDLETDLDLNLDGTIRPQLPTLDQLLSSPQLDLNGFLFAYAALEFGNPLLAALQFEALTVKAGIKQSGSFRSAQAQAADNAYASNYKLDLTGSAGVGSGFLGFMAMLNTTPPMFDLFNISLPLATSPVGTLTITDPNGGSSATPSSPARVRAGSANELGEMASFNVNFSSVNYLFDPYIVSGVELFFFGGNGTVEKVRLDAEHKGGAGLEPGRPGCNSFTAASGQVQFTCQTDFLQQHLGNRRFMAFATTQLLGVEIPFPLEIGDATLEVFGDQLFFFDFNDGLQGWQTHDAGRAFDSVNWDSTHDGSVRLDGSDFAQPEDPPVRNSWITHGFSLPSDTARLEFETRANSDNDGALRVSLVDGNGATHVLLDWEVLAGSSWRQRGVNLSSFAGQNVTLLFEQDDNDVGIGEHRYVDNVAILRSGNQPD